MRINIVLPIVAREPIGGFKVEYEYANRLYDSGFNVAIYHGLNFDRRVITHPRSIAGLVTWNIRGSRKIPWFSLNQGIHCHYLPQITPGLLRPADATILTSYETAERVPRATARTGRLFQIVYDYEFWHGGTDETRKRIARSLLRNDVQHIATSSAVYNMLCEIGVVPIGLVTCGIDLPLPSLIPPTSTRRPIVAFPVRRVAHKGAAEMLNAIPLIQSRHPEAEFECFGASDGFEFPKELRVHGYLDDQELLALYQRCMVFVLPSYAEGWGLPAAEAMANGAALVVTDNGGSNDFSIDGETSLVVPIQDSGAIADATSTLLADEYLRQRIVAGGIERARDMSWPRSMDRLIPLLTEPAS